MALRTAYPLARGIAVHRDYALREKAKTRSSGTLIARLGGKRGRAFCALEREKGIEPSRLAWEASRLPLHHSRVASVIIRRS
jgi:hypothetical protein